MVELVIHKEGEGKGFEMEMNNIHAFGMQYRLTKSVDKSLS